MAVICPVGECTEALGFYLDLLTKASVRARLCLGLSGEPRDPPLVNAGIPDGDGDGDSDGGDTTIHTSCSFSK